MSIRDELVLLARQAYASLAPITVSRVLVIDPRPSADRDAEFGMVELDDGSAGLYYAWLGPSQSDMQSRFKGMTFSGISPLELVEYVYSDSDGERSIGIATINALTEAFYRASGYKPPEAPDSVGGIKFEPTDHVGMIGYFPPLVRQLRNKRLPMTIVERKVHLLESDDTMRVTLDPSLLYGCNKVICTGATLLNNSLDNMLQYCHQADTVALLGPTVGFFPDPLLKRDIDRIGGTRVVDTDRARISLEKGHKIGDSAIRTLITKNTYPGFEALQQRHDQTD